MRTRCRLNTKPGVLKGALVLLISGAILGVACAPQSAPAHSDGAAVAQPSGSPKTLRMGTLKEPSTGIAVFAGSSNMSAQHMWMFHAGLTALDPQGNLQPRVALKVPSIDDGDWKLLPDGSMEVTWKLRPNVQWHDGTP